MKVPEVSAKAESGGDRPVVHVIFKDLVCAECGVELLRGDFTIFDGPNHLPICLGCSGLDRLLYLTSGNAALTRRATKYSTLSAVVVKFSRHRKRNERQGVLVEPAALERAETECLVDAEARARARERAAVRREAMDVEYLKRFTERLKALFPGCPDDEARAIAEHACEKHSGRVGRSASAKNLDDQAITLAVRAHIRHVHTRYDSLLGKGCDRAGARAAVAERIHEVVELWKK